MSRLLDFIHRHEPQGETLAHLKSGAGALVGMTLVGGLAAVTGLPLLFAPLGATAVLIFGQPEAAFSQPANVLGGYLLAAVVATLLFGLLGPAWWVATIATGVVIALMLVLRVTHPAAGAIPLLAAGSHMNLAMLDAAVLGGALCLVLVALVHHRIPPRRVYPKPRGVVVTQPAAVAEEA